MDDEELITSKLHLDFDIKDKFELNEHHREFLDTVLKSSTKMTFVDGPAGSAKTYLAVLAALTMLKQGKCKNIVYIRSIAESASKSMGSLPGEVDEKFAPWSMPLVEKLDELLIKSHSNHLIDKGFIRCIPVNFIRGLTFNESAVIVDEAQNLTYKELVTILTRFGMWSHYMIVGDTFQSDINSKSGFKPIYDAFEKANVAKEGFETYKFEESDIVRSPELKTIVKVLESVRLMH